ncbi:putative deoxyribonuclease TATDN2 [Portunus trituberculatus]|uniref:Putative deoxyribonuclease TATDN2 n=1 Tax=Portunus trituberculatus TaxID=210409 RepID=A0A5B7JG55_PORTR|nr:putative deoxyribonuclease TATDN2 [Portunus trituberculatus]
MVTDCGMSGEGSDAISWWEAIIEEVGVWAAFGCHPHFADHFGDEEEAYLQVALMNSNTLALGEIGLDYHKK